MGKSRGDYKRRNPVTREMIERHRNTVHQDKRRQVKYNTDLDTWNPDDYDTVLDDAGNVNVIYIGGKDE